MRHPSMLCFSSVAAGVVLMRHIPLMLFLLPFFLPHGTARGEAPGNDAYDTPTALVTGETGWSGNGAETTALPGELTPPLVERQEHSIWYTWTAGATGWHAVEPKSEGEEEPFYEGGYVGLWRDEETAPPVFIQKFYPGGGFVFHAEAGARYRLCFADEKGGPPPPERRGLLLAPQPAPALEVTSFSVKPEGAGEEIDEQKEIDTGAGPVRLRVRFAFRANTAEDPVMWYLSCPGLENLWVPFDAARLVSGTAREGIYEVPLEIPGYLSPRRLYYNISYQRPALTVESAGFMGKAVFSLTGTGSPPVAAPSLDARNGGKVDTTPPVLTRCAADKDTVDNSQIPEGDWHGVPVEFTLETGDDSGVARLLITLCDEEGKVVDFREMLSNEGKAGEAAGAWIWETPMRINREGRPGRYMLMVYCEDFNGNTSNTVSWEPGFPGPFAGLRVAWPSAIPRYPVWLSAWFSAEDAAREEISGETADPDGDGIPNFLEYALGLPPLTRDADCGTSAGMDEDGTGQVEFRYTRAAGVRQEVRYEVQHAETPAGPWRWVMPRSVRTTVESNGEDLDSERVRETVRMFFTAEGRGFYRLVVTKPAEPPEPQPKLKSAKVTRAGGRNGNG